MTQYIDKAAVVAEIERIKNTEYNENFISNDIACCALDMAIDAINTLKVKEVETWHLQEKEDIYDALKDWSFHTFACIMKDGTIQMFSGTLDEDCEGHINVHIDGVNDDYDDVDDIVKWIEIT